MAIFLGRHPTDDQISRLRLPLLEEHWKGRTGRTIVIETLEQDRTPRASSLGEIRIDTS